MHAYIYIILYRNIKAYKSLRKYDNTYALTGGYNYDITIQQECIN